MPASLRRHPLVLALALALAAGRAPAKERPRVDYAAMREAMTVTESEVSFTSSATYSHFLKSRLHHAAGNHAQAADELQLALASQPGQPFLVTELAEEYARLDDLPRAERLLLGLGTAQPRYFPAQLLLGHVQLEEKKLARAKLTLRHALKLEPKSTETYLMLAQIALEEGAPDEAVQVVKDLTAATGEAVGLRRLGGALSERGDVARAEPLLLRATEVDPGDAEGFVLLAQCEEAQDHSAEAEAAYAHALERDPDNQDALLNAGRVALHAGSVPRARAYFDRLLTLSEDAETVVKIAFSYLANQQLSAAAQVLDETRKLRKGEPRISFYSGLVHERANEFSRATEAFNEVPLDSELGREARLHLGNCLVKTGHPGKALALLGAGLKAHPDDLGLVPAYAQTLEASGDRPGAEAYLRNMLRERPAPEVFEALADLFQRTGRLPEAVSLMEGAVAQRPQDEVLLFTLAAAYERAGEYEKSMAQMRHVLDLNPENAAAMNFIAYTLAEKGEHFDEAERLLNRALQLKPDNGAFLDSLGWVYFRRGDYTRAVPTLERAAALAPGEPTIIEHLGDAYRSAARTGQAAAAYKRALDALRLLPEAEGQRSGLERKLKLLSSDAPGR